ncbi:MAG: alpha-galactosidase [Fimbriimonas sp.]
MSSPIATDAVEVSPMRPTIQIGAGSLALTLTVDEDGRLLQSGFGAPAETDPAAPLAYPAAGDGWIYEPALQAVHADGNTSTDLRYVAHSTNDGVTRIELKDPEYAFFVDLYFQVREGHAVLEAWTEIRHEEEGEVVLEQFASSAPDFGAGPFFLTQFRGDWNDEMHMEEEPLGYGRKVLDSKLGVRAHQFRSPWFLLAKGATAREAEGEVFGGTLAWSGSFQYAFERSHEGRVRALCGINPYASAYHLASGDRFETPRMLWGYSASGTRGLSHAFHRWGREHGIRDGFSPRSILLNNWEATYFDFDEAKIVSLFDGAKALGMETFLLDDGWFGEKYPRDADTQGLGDWTPDPKKLPNGVRALVDEAKARGLRFGIWLEPEMVNPRSELFEAHPDWAIQQPKRALEVQRNQLVLDLANPEVKEYVFGLVDKVLTDNPGISYVKWDCNRYVTQPGSPYLPANRQSHLWIEYVRALYEILDRVAQAHPNVQIMTCSGGGGRLDYGAMRYAHEFWPSDNTDPARRVFIQWGCSYFFPAISTSAHVTDMGRRPLKFAFDVAMSGRLGMDMDVDKLSQADREFAARTVAAYKGIREVVQLGELYRLESPYDGPRSSLMYRYEDRVVLFVYSLGEAPAAPVRLEGLDADRTYRVREIDATGETPERQTAYSGADLMDAGLPLDGYGTYGSGVFELVQA